MSQAGQGHTGHWRMHICSVKEVSFQEGPPGEKGWDHGLRHELYMNSGSEYRLGFLQLIAFSCGKWHIIVVT